MEMKFILAVCLAVICGAWIGYVVYPLVHPYEPEDDDFYDCSFEELE